VTPLADQRDMRRDRGADGRLRAVAQPHQPGRVNRPGRHTEDPAVAEVPQIVVVEDLDGHARTPGQVRQQIRVALRIQAVGRRVDQVAGDGHRLDDGAGVDERGRVILPAPVVPVPHDDAEPGDGPGAWWRGAQAGIPVGAQRVPLDRGGGGEDPEQTQDGDTPGTGVRPCPEDPGGHPGGVPYLVGACPGMSQPDGEHLAGTRVVRGRDRAGLSRGSRRTGLHERLPQRGRDLAVERRPVLQRQPGRPGEHGDHQDVDRFPVIPGGLGRPRELRDPDQGWDVTPDERLRGGRLGCGPCHFGVLSARGWGERGSGGEMPRGLLFPG
jgi:hypothetical protein